MTSSQRPSEPMFNFTEKAPVYLAGIFIAIQAVFSILPGLKYGLLGKFSLLQPLGVSSADNLSHAISLIGHGFRHGGWGHTLMNTGMTIVFGIATIRGAKMLPKEKGRITKASRDFLLIFLAGVIIGGLFQWGWWSVIDAHLGQPTGAVGASGGASALFAAGAWAIGGREKMLQFGSGWAIINVVMVLLEKFIGVGIAWPAHMGGYIAGMILAPLFVKPHSTRLTML